MDSNNEKIKRVEARKRDRWAISRHLTSVCVSSSGDGGGENGGAQPLVEVGTFSLKISVSNRLRAQGSWSEKREGNPNGSLGKQATSEVI